MMIVLDVATHEVKNKKWSTKSERSFEDEEMNTTQRQRQRR